MDGQQSTLMIDSTQRRLVSFERVGASAPAPVDWLVDGLLARNTLAALVGPSGCGKTFTLCSLAAHVALGRPWLGHKVSAGAVFILAGEGRSGLRKRFLGLACHHGFSVDTAPIFIADWLPPLCESQNVDEVVETILLAADDAFFRNGAASPSLVIVDTVARAMGGANENAASDMGALISALDRIRISTGATVLAVHHTGHDRSDRARGSSAFFAALDTELLLLRTKGSSFVLKTSKAKDWREPPPLGLRFESVEFAIPSVDDSGNPIAAPESTLVVIPDEASEPVAGAVELVTRYKEQGLTQSEINRKTGIPLTTVNRHWHREHR